MQIRHYLFLMSKFALLVWAVNSLFAAEQLAAKTKEHTTKFVNTLQETADQADYFPVNMYIDNSARRFLLLIINFESVAFEIANLP